MSQQNAQINLAAHSFPQYLLYIFIGFVIWLMGVIIVRIVGDTVFSAGSVWLFAFFALSIPTAFVTMFVTAPICRLPMRDMLIPILGMLGTTLILDGLSITFTDIYSADNNMAMHVAGWLLWTFGIQVVVSMWMIGRANTG